jgi:catechol 2,3-dioxygenase-like lactoylglutathione lyase family enzyme
MTELEKVQIDMKLEVVVLGVSDVDRAKAFYEKLGSLDHLRQGNHVGPFWLGGPGAQPGARRGRRRRRPPRLDYPRRRRE